MSTDGHICLGIDVGTSTCQAYGGTAASVQPLYAVDRFVRDDYPSLILDSGEGQRLFGFEARHAGARPGSHELHEHFKAYMRSDHPLPPRYSVDQAVALFGACAEHFSGRVLPKVLDYVDHLSAPTIDVAWTMPAGWRKSPGLEAIYHREIGRLQQALTKLHGGLVVHGYMIEEPVAALLSLEGKVERYPEGAPILTIDAGGGTLDAAVCSYRKTNGLREFEVEFTDSTGLAGVALMREFVAYLQASGAFRPQLPPDWERQAPLRASVEELFQSYYAPGRADDVAEELRPHAPGKAAIACAFSRRAADEALFRSPTVAKQRIFLQGILDAYNKRVPPDRQAIVWRNVRAFGGLTRHPVFRQVVQEVLPSTVFADEPTLAIAHGAALHARQAGRLISGRRTEFHLCQRLYRRGDGDEMFFQVVVPRGTMIAREGGREFEGASQARAFSPTGSMHAYLAWTNGEELSDARGKPIFEGTVGFGTPIQRGDPFTTTVRFDDMLRIEVEETHKPSKIRRKLTSKLGWE